MSFVTPVFLFLFFPITLLGYYLIHPKLKNIFLLVSSLMFYFWGEPKFIIVFAASIAFNYIAGFVMGKLRGLSNLKRIVMLFSVAINIGLLFYYKYLMFSTETVNTVLNTNFPVKEITLPLGISFFTFRAISYILDVYWETSVAQKNPINVALYISFFPQVVMGPITKSSDFLPQLTKRKFELNKFTNGIKCFIIGMAKKLIIADSLAVIVNPVFSMAADERTVVAAWYGIIGYCLQLFFDFSGYSDMAIGLSKMFGFDTPENFNYPYMSKGAVEFWSRWHITLGTWLKDYVYTPVFKGLLSKKKDLFVCDTLALLMVWLVAGIWHGAAWHYVTYGLYYFCFILLERIIEYHEKKRRKRLKLKKQPETKFHATLSHIYFIIVLIFGQLMFRIDGNSLENYFCYIGSMFGRSGSGFTDSYSLFTLKSNLRIFLLGILFCFPVTKKIKKMLTQNDNLSFIIENIVMPIGWLTLFVLCVSCVLMSNYNAFIYQQF